MTLSLLRKRYFGASLASRAIKHKQTWQYWQMDKICISSLCTQDDNGFHLLRSWILRKMKKMRIAMRTIAIPAPITIPTILTENKKEHSHSTHSPTHSDLFTEMYKLHLLFYWNTYSNNAFPAEGSQHRYIQSCGSWFKHTMLVCSSSSTNVLKLLNPSWRREGERNRDIVQFCDIHE